MSNLIIRVCKIDRIRSHPGADRLEICEVLGWQCVVQKDVFCQGDKIVYFPPDTLLPEEWTDKFGVTKYCNEKNNMRRVHRTRLRGEPSFGLVVKPENPNWEIDHDVTEFYSAQKYEPPIVCKADDAAPADPLFPNYIEIENLRNYPRIFEIGEEVVLTEKIHGSNVKIMTLEGVKQAGSRKHNRKEPENYITSLYWYAWSVPEIQAMMEQLGKIYKQIILYGEVFGPVQFLKYNSAHKLDFAAFDLYIDGKFVDYDFFKINCNAYNVKTVPEVARINYSLEEVAKYSEGKTLMNNADHIREGVVVRPVKERMHSKIGRVILKYVSDTYLLGKSSKKDTTDI